MLSAITASTGACGTRTQPSVAAASVMLCATVKDHQQRQHEQQVVDAQQDVLDTQGRVGARYLPPALGIGHDERIRGRGQAFDLDGLVQPLETGQHVGEGRRQAVDADFVPAQPPRAAADPALDKGGVLLPGTHFAHGLAMLRQARVQRHAQIAAGRNPPEHIEGLGIELFEVQVARAHLVRREVERAQRQRRQQNPSRQFQGPLSPLSSKLSMVMVYCSARRS
jgi:hypothetical protein